MFLLLGSERTECSSLCRHQTDLHPEWQSECRFPSNDQRAPWLCAPTTKGFTVPMMSGEREFGGRAGEKKGGEIERREATDKGYAEMKGQAKGGGGRRGNRK